MERQFDKYVFLIKINVASNEPIRRRLLSTINSIYDPLGFVEAVTLKTKRILQKNKQIDDLQWDDPLPPKLMARWMKWTDALDNLQ